MRDFPEPDWRIFREVIKSALERYFVRTLDEVSSLTADTSLPPRDRYHGLYQLVQNRDRELASAFDNPRRSTALFQLVRLRHLDLISDEEFARFSAETRQRVELIMSPVP